MDGVNEQDPRLPIIAQMAAIIYAEHLILSSSEKAARHHAIDDAFLLYGEIAVRLANSDRLAGAEG